jgi:hypothetical protein
MMPDRIGCKIARSHSVALKWRRSGANLGQAAMRRIHARRNRMKRFYAGLATAAVAALAGFASMAPARSAPPTVTPSPGYDARLQEQRAARPVYEPIMPRSRPAYRRRAKRIRGGAY